MASNGLPNGTNGAATLPGSLKRFSYLPQVLDISIDQDAEVVGIDLQDELLEDPTELCTLLENESVQRGYWISIATAYAKQQRLDSAIDFLRKGQQAFQHAPAAEQLSFLNALIWMYLWKARKTPVSLANDLSELYNEIATDPDTKMNGMHEQSFGEDEGAEGTRQRYILYAKRAINEAMRLDPRSIPLTLARGALMLIEANQITPGPSGPGMTDRSERAKRLQEAYNTFDAAYKASGGYYIPAVFGKARAQFMMGQYSQAYVHYQEILRRAPHQIDPDPRVGIGACLWQLGHYEDARAAWERAQEVNPDSKIAHIYLGIYWLHSSSQYSANDPRFKSDYEKAISRYVMKAFKIDEFFPLSCSTFSSYFMMGNKIANGQKLAYRAIRGTDSKPIASDAWYLIGRSKHAEGLLDEALIAYRKAEELRGGADAGYLPAKLGIAQILILRSQLESTPDSERPKNIEAAKTILEQMVRAKSLEASELLGTVLAEEVFAAHDSALDDKSKDKARAIALLEQVRMAWNDPKKHLTPDSRVLLNLARLYETDSPEKSLSCLTKVEDMELEVLPQELKPEGEEDPVKIREAQREFLPPQLLNNMGCFYYQNEKYTNARSLFQTALNACVKIGDQDPSNDTDALVTTISYNLGRCYEAEGMLDEAEKIYRGLLSRHPDYTDGNARLAYIAFKKDPQKSKGEDTIEAVYQANKDNLEVRALYGWWCNKVKRRTLNVAEDSEQRFYKVTLQQFDKHDPYSLTGMGNIYLAIAREMKRESEEDRTKRNKMYEKAVEFFDKALQYDPNNAYAAQGVGIAMAEAKKDYSAAIQIFAKVREAIKDPSVYINLGHVYCEVKQYTRAIECYEQALAKVDKDHRVAVLLYLGRVWTIRGKNDRNLAAFNNSLNYTRQAQEINPTEITIRFNVAFVQYQIAQLLISLNTTQRTLEDVVAAQKGLDAAIASFREIAQEPNTPYPRQVIESRANMSQNTMKRQLERAAADQRDYEEKNADRLKKAKEARDAEERKREEERLARSRAEEERRAKALEQRLKDQERDRLLAERRAEEERRKEDELMTTDSETGERKKREKKKKAPKGDGSSGKKGSKKSKDRVGTEDELSGPEGERRSRSGTGSAEPSTSTRKRKRGTATRMKGKKSDLSAEFVQDSDEEDEAGVAAPKGAAVPDEDGTSAPPSPAAAADSPMKDVFGESEDEDLDEDLEKVARPRKKHVRVVDEEDEDE
jgi:RNA polymerase-associated protein CTR9